MARMKALEALDMNLKDRRGNTKLMGGALVLLCGDIRQTLPVVPESTPADEIYARLKNSVKVNLIKLRKNALKENMRVLLGDENAQLFQIDFSKSERIDYKFNLPTK
ncbi:hypothetical protein AVEN_274914-1 [Araneus ventricosus]|uniref:ATP-dependent DNA helicase n=1 Tax=Araneus ventricosus TaxID=182803 RepID=A0A4Y2JXF3_ARAVE|nr:hypothetical protein AVEN_274914-1 [Araneus ventricosus]